MIRLRVGCLVLCLVWGLLSGSAAADLIIFDTLTTPVEDQANLLMPTAQTFTTPVDLAGSNRLATIEIAGPAVSGTSSLTYALQIWKWDAAHDSYVPGAALGESTVVTIEPGTTGIFDFSPLNIRLDASTVYGILFTDGAGNPENPRLGLTQGNDGVGAAGGTLFSQGIVPFGGNYDAAARITTVVPEPASLVLGLIGCLLGHLLVAKRRRR